LDRSTVDERILATGNEAGTAPDDRRFRPDVEGLRAVAVLLVVLYHANVPRVTGGFVGVDVFFVISGFVITGLLLRERQGTGSTSLLNFYARRVRRILPAATLVILITVAASYLFIDSVAGNTVADDGRWAAAFLANFHFEAIGTNYFTASRAPSPLQNFWSLSVEEQFYLVYPTLFLLMARLKGRLSLQVKMAITLVVVVIASYWLSIVQTASHPASAYFSPLTRAWELALGALVAVTTPWLKQMPPRVAILLTWTGLAAIAVAAFSFTAQTAYPGSLVAIPVVGAGLIIAGGVGAPRFGAERLLGLRPFQWFGQRSYSLYLWHWPILIIVAEYADKSTLPVGENLLLVVLAIAIASVSYRAVENPIRHWKLPSRATVAAGIALCLTTIVVLSLLISAESGGAIPNSSATAANLQTVLHKVAVAKSIAKLPHPLEPEPAVASDDYGGLEEGAGCEASVGESTEKLCFLGDPHSDQLIIVYGDSHAPMWLPAFNSVAKSAHMRLLVLGKPDCPASPVNVANPQGVGPRGGIWGTCTSWHTWAIKTINSLNPNILVISQDTLYTRPYTSPSEASTFSPTQWSRGLKNLFKMIPSERIKKVYLGNIPLLVQSGPLCLSRHPDDVQACSRPVYLSNRSLDSTDRSVAAELHIKYIDPTPWFCSNICTAVVGHYDVYMDLIHVSGAYAQYLSNALAQALFGTAPAFTLDHAPTVVRLARPFAGSTLTGSVWLDGAATMSDSTVTRIEFRLSGGGFRKEPLGIGAESIVGWLFHWNTATVPNGSYSLQIFAYDAAGKSERSKPVTITVHN
jgi:peptidoglycan/LPS O-acetylase OafA/YrhL